jgi:hypothetical protein
MTNAARDRKISNFTAQTSVPSGSYFSFIFNGQNFKILDNNFYSSLGVTGTIVQKGDPLGAPVLNKAGSVNEIRNIESGSGVQATVSPQGGVLLDHRFTAKTTGFPILTDVSADNPVIRSIQQGAGIQILEDNDVLTISATGTVPATKAIIVNSIDDFPDPVSGVITLDADTAYVISNDITTANRFVLQNNTAVVGYSALVGKLEYTGTGTMFTAVDANIAALNLRYACPAGKAWDVSDTVGGVVIFDLTNSQCQECDTFGDFDDLFAINFSNSNCLDVNTDGIVFTGSNWSLISLDRFAFITANTSFVGFDLGTCVSSAIELNDLFIVGPSGAIALTGAANSANISAGGLGTLTNSNFDGGITPVTVIDFNSDIRWESTGNDDIADSTEDALMSIQGNVTQTIITVAGTPVKMVGVWTDEGSSRFTTDVTGRMTYNGERDSKLPIDITVSVEPASGTNINLAAYIAVNGSVVSATKKVASASSGSPASITMIWQRTFSENDYVEVWLANEDNTTNVIGSSGVGRIN